MKIKQKNTIDMTHGTLWNKLLIFALPLAASSILQQLFNSVDTAVVGRFASSRAFGRCCRCGTICGRSGIGGRGKQQFAHRTDD